MRARSSCILCRTKASTRVIFVNCACLASPCFLFRLFCFFFYFPTVSLHVALSLSLFFSNYFLFFFYSLFPSLLKIPRLQRFQRATMHVEIQGIIIPISLYPGEKCVSSGCKWPSRFRGSRSLILDIVLRAQKDLGCFFFPSSHPFAPLFIPLRASPLTPFPGLARFVSRAPRVFSNLGRKRP